jgi:general secretion pathway protein K
VRPKRERGRGPRRDRGFALLIVLWSLVLFSLLVSAIAAAGSGRARQAAAFGRNAQLRACADGGIEQALFHVLDSSPARWPADGRVHRLRSDGFALALSATSQAGKLNPNTASAALLAGLLQAVGADGRTAQQIATAMMVWRYPTGETGPLPGRDYRPPGAAFESLGELGLVPGMTQALLKRLVPELSLYHSGDPDLSDADPVMRRALAMAAGLDPFNQGDAAQDPSAQAPPQQRYDPSVVEVRAEASDGAGHRFLRRAIALTGNGGGNQDSSGTPRPFKIVAWEAPGT